MSWLFSRALVEEFSEGTCLGGEPYAQLNVMPTPHKFWRNDKTMEFSSLSRFGLTLNLLTEQDGEELLMSFLEGSRARTLALPVLGPGWRESAVASGLNSSASLAKFDQNTSSLRTAQPSLLEDLIEFSPTLPVSGLMLDGRCYQLPTAAVITKESGRGSLPTPLKSWGSRGPGLSNNLENLRACLGMTQRTLAIVKAVGWRWPASFIEWMMGWPIHWSALKPLEMAKFQSWLQRHGKS